MPTWVPPPALGEGGLTEMLDKMYPLKVFNSLTRTKTRFVPKDPDRVLWYMCGPTVYAPSHMGHARTYLHFDILRRVMTDFFGYDVSLCMNITDIDDKIITRANENKQDFRELAAHFENDYMQDMALLGVRAPTVVTRVSEFIPEVVEYIQGIIDNGYAYESNGSVYFDVQSFDGKKGHAYAKLLPEGVGNGELMAEGEGALSLGAGDKRSSGDFALWKRSREGEPSWESPWGQGRPGWHIECSVMASATFEGMGDGTMDIHSGGVDLKFPHHDNEMAQAEAKYDCGQWVNYFLHTGHLHIKGFKMSKSLKNFITIKQALEENTSRQARKKKTSRTRIRLLFLLHKYNTPMDYGDDAMSGALSAEKIFSEFFHNVKAALRRTTARDPARTKEAELALMSRLSEAKKEVKRSLCDDFDTPGALSALQELVKAVNKARIRPSYLETKERAGETIVADCVRGAAEYVTKIFKVFGLASLGPALGFSQGGDASGNAAGGAGGGGGEDGSREAVLGPVLDVLSEFRDRARGCGRAGDTKGVLAACDHVRDELLPTVGVRLEDKGDQVVWKLEDPAVLARERQQREQEQARYISSLRRLEAKEEAKRKAAEKEARAKIPATEYFRGLKGESGEALYTQFDDKGVPTHNAAGEEITKEKARRWKKKEGGRLPKKVKKEWGAQNMLYTNAQAKANKK
ncbi:unnamed protein product [Pylaiella littoralis]